MVRNTNERGRGLRVVVAAAAFAAVLAVGVAPAVAGTAAPATATDGQAGATPDVEQVSVKSAGLAFEYPSAWVQLDFSKRDAKSIIEAVAVNNPGLAEHLDPSVLEGLDFYAISPGGGNNVNVRVSSPGTLIADKRFVEAQLESAVNVLPGFEMLGVEKVKLGRAPAFRANYRLEGVGFDGSPSAVRGAMLITRKRGTAGQLVFVTATVADVPEDVAVADAIIRSVHPL